MGWPDQPIPIELWGGMPVAPINVDHDALGYALIDISTPITVFNKEAQSERLADDGAFGDYRLLVNLGKRTGDLRLRDAADPSISRFIFRDVRVFDLPIREVGLDQTFPVNGILGGDLLTRFVVRIDYASPPSLTLGKGMADTDEELSADCDAKDLIDVTRTAPDCSAVLRASRYGGGTILLGHEEETIAATRLVVGACMAPQSFDPRTTTGAELAESSGVPVSALVSTALGVSVIARSAFERLKGHRPELVETGEATLHLPNGEHAVSLTEIPGLALVDDLAVDLGPCQELARRRRLLLAYREGLDSRDRDRLGSAVGAVDQSLTFVILADESALLQGLRNELRPLVADVDVVLGTNLLSHFRPAFDFPGGRVVLRCASESASCHIIPRCYHDERQPPCPREASP